MSDGGGRPPQVRDGLPRSVSLVALVMLVVGVVALAAGTIGVADPDTGGALASMVVMAAGAVLVLVGWRLRMGERWAYLAAVVVLGLLLVGWVVRAIVERESWFIGQLLGPGLGLWALLRPEAREHFGR